MARRGFDKPGKPGGDDGPARGKPTRGKAGRIGHDAPTTENISIFDDGDNAYAEAVGAGHRVDPRMRKIVIAGVALVVLYVFALVIPKDLLNEAFHHATYHSGYTFSWFIEDLQSNVNGIVAVLTGHDAEVGYGSIMIRYVLIALTGAGLALCGAVYQGSFRNALVSPSTMGVMSGASAGMILWVLFYVNDDCSNVTWISNISDTMVSTLSEADDPLGYLYASYSLSIYSFIGCALIAGLVLTTMALSKKGSTSGFMIIITGQVFGGIIGGITSSVRYYMTEMPDLANKLELMNNMQIGSFYRNYSIIDILAVGIPIVLCVAVVMLLRQRMMALSLGMEEARAMGVDTKKTQLLIVGVSTLLTAVLISFCGRVGFVGFLVPHLARRMVGPNFKYLLPASMVVGGVFVLGAYLLVSCTLGPDYETMVGMFISIGGSAVFLVQALRGIRGGGGMGNGFPR